MNLLNSHFRSFSILINKHLPVIFIKTIVNWYLILEIVIRWDGVELDQLRSLNGVRQGGVLSPLLFNIYVDCIINNLENSGLGFHYVLRIIFRQYIIMLEAYQRIWIISTFI